MNLISFIVVGLYVTNKFLVGNVFKWLIFDIFFPVIITVLIGIAVISLPEFTKFSYMFIIESMVIGLLSVLVNIIVYNKCNPANKLFSILGSGSK